MSNQSLEDSLQSVWYRSLEPHPKGRKTKVKHNKKKLRKLVNKNEIDQLREELTKKNQELYDAKFALMVDCLLLSSYI